MKHTLKTLYAWIEKHAQPLTQYNIGEYCKQSNEIKKNKQYHYGYNSLKWLIYSLREKLSRDEIQNLFWDVLSERKSMNRSLHDLQRKILSFRSVKPYLDMLNENRTDLSKLVKVRFNGYTIFLNPTNQNLTSILIGKKNADMVIFKNPDNGDAGVVVNTSGKLIDETKLLADFYFELGKTEDGWAAINKSQPMNRFNLFIRADQKSQSQFDVTELLEAFIKAFTFTPKPYLWNVSIYENENVVLIFPKDDIYNAIVSGIDMSSGFDSEFEISTKNVKIN